MGATVLREGVVPFSEELVPVTGRPWWACAGFASAFIAVLIPVSRALAVVLVGRLVSKDLAKLAIPLVLRSVGSTLFAVWRDRRHGRPLDGPGADRAPTDLGTGD